MSWERRTNMRAAEVLIPAFAVLSSLALVSSKGINFPRQPIALGVHCVNPDRSRGTCEAYNECASFSIRAYIRGEIGVCGFMPNGDPAVCCQVAANTGRPPFNGGNHATAAGGGSSPSNTNNNNQQQSPQGGGNTNSRDDKTTNDQPGPNNGNQMRPPFNGANPPPTFMIPGISVGFDPEVGDLARILAQQRG